MNYLITGGTGFIGSYLRSRLLKDGHHLTIITRSPANYRGEQAKNQKFISWDNDLPEAMRTADVVINLAGENIFGRWNSRVKRSIYESRIRATRQLVEAMEAAGDDRPGLFISASGVGYYGERGAAPVDESVGAGDDFMATVCRDWETEAMKAARPGVRVAIPRIAVALQSGDGMLRVMKIPFQFFVGGSVGSGRQYVPWVHMDDLCSAILFPVEEVSLEGPYNTGSPDPVTMNELAAAMGRVMNRPSFFKVPSFALKLALGDGAAPALTSLNVQPARLRELGFRYEFTDLEEALADVL